MTIKEKLALMAKTRQENAKRLKAWMEERTADHGKDGADQ